MAEKKQATIAIRADATTGRRFVRVPDRQVESFAGYKLSCPACGCPAVMIYTDGKIQCAQCKAHFGWVDMKLYLGSDPMPEGWDKPASGALILDPSLAPPNIRSN